MHLIFIRHGDPDYEHDSLTPKGFREAELLSDRIAAWNVTDFYVSPYGRAQKTLQPALLKMNRTAETKDWLHEFDYKVTDAQTGKSHGCWDWMPRTYYSQKNYFDRFKWHKTKTMKSGGIAERYKTVCAEFDKLLAAYDYNRLDADTPVYNCLPHLSQEEATVDTHLQASQKDLDEKNLVFVCHLGSMFTIISHLTGLSPMQLWQGFFVAPTSVTVLGAEERVPGEVVFRVQMLGDIRHLKQGSETASASGFFGNFTEF